MILEELQGVVAIGVPKDCAPIVREPARKAEQGRYEVVCKILGR